MLHRRAVALAVLGAYSCSDSKAPFAADTSELDVLDVNGLFEVSAPSLTQDDAVAADAIDTEPRVIDDVRVDSDALGTETVCPVPAGLHCVAGGAAVAEASASIPVAAFDGHFLCELSLTSPTPCDVACDLGQCVAEGDFRDYRADHIEYIVDIQLSEPGCCFDFDGDGVPDNALGDGLDVGASMRGGVGDIDATIGLVVRTGRAVVALTRSAIGDETELALIHASPAMDVSAFVYPPEPPVVMSPRETAFVAGTATPRSRVRITEEGGDWVSTGDVLRIDLPIGLKIALPIIARGLKLRYTKAETGGHVALGGYVLLAELLESMNAAFAVGGDCACMGAEGPLVGLSDAEPFTFHAAPGVPLDGSGCGPESFCAEFAIAAASGLLGEVLRPDIDVNGDGILDALTVGLALRTLPGVLASPP